MTASLLEQLEKRRAPKASTSRGSISRDPPSGFAAAVVEATAASSAKGRGAVGADIVGNPSTPERATSSGKATVAPCPSHPGVGCPPSGAGASPGVNGAVDLPGGKKEEEDYGGATDPIPSVGRAVGAQPARERVEAAAATRRRVEAERRRTAALATIKNHRSQYDMASAALPGAVATATAPAAAAASPPPPAAAAGGAGDSAATTRSPGAAATEVMPQVGIGPSSASTVPTTGATTGKTSRALAAGTSSLKMTTAFSRQSVRSGVTLGYYGREEMDVLTAISKNPSRIAAYTRITEGKRGSEDDGACPEVRSRER